MSVYCGQCGAEYKDDAEYLNTVCKATGVAPTDPLSMGKNWARIQDLALDRGKSETTPEKLAAAKLAVKNKVEAIKAKK